MNQGIILFLNYVFVAALRNQTHIVTPIFQSRVLG